MKHSVFVSERILLLKREYEKDNLISEQTKLNDEASVIFMSMMTPEMLTPKEST